MKKVLAIVIALALLPVFASLVHGDDTINAYSPNVVSFASYLDDRGVDYTGDSMNFTVSTTIHSIIDDSFISIDVGTGFDWYLNIPLCTSGCYPQWTYWYNTDVDGITVYDGYEQTSYRINYDGTVYDDYFFYTNDRLEVNMEPLDTESLDYHGWLFFGEYGYTFAQSDLSESRVKGWTYDKDEDSGGMSALEAGELIFLDGILGMIPRINDAGVIEVPVIKNLMILAYSATYIVWDEVLRLIRQLFGIEDFDPDIDYTKLYYNVGNWSVSGTTHTYIVQPATIWGGERIRYEENTGYYYKDYARLWVWIKTPSFISDELMQWYEDETNDFE